MARTTGSDGARTGEAIRQAAIDLIAARGFEAGGCRPPMGRVAPTTVAAYAELLETYGFGA